MASQEQLNKIAKRCHEYSPHREDSLKSSTSNTESNASCVHCHHYTREHRCNLNLIDKILSSMAMELDEKS